MRFGIIGGGFGVYAHLAAISSLEGSDVISVADSGSGSILKCLPDTSLYQQSWENMLNQEIDAVCVATPPKTHKDIVLKLIESGKHVLCEKPFGINLLQSKEMTKAARSANIKGAVTYQYRYEPGFQVLKKLLQDEYMGKLLTVKCNWLTSGRRNPQLPWTWRNDSKQGGGVIGAFMSHVIDLFQWILDDEINEVEANTKIIVPLRPTSDSNSMQKVTSEDYVDAQFTMSSGILATCAVGNCNPKALGMELELKGTKGKLVYTHKPPFNSETQEIHFFDINGNAKLLFNAKELLGLESGDTRLPALKNLLMDFVNITDVDGQSDLPTFNVGCSVQSKLQAIHHSVMRKERVAC